MNRFDYVIVNFLNHFAHRSWALDAFISTIEESNLLKGGFALALFWWAWFKQAKPASEKREVLLFGLLSSCFALLIGRVISLWIPFRERPFQNPLYHFQMPFAMTGGVHSWNSSPSDHAVLFFCLAACLWMVSRPLGIVAMCHVVFIVSLPRIYVGYHYPSDIVLGATIGIAAAFLCKFAALRKRATQPAFSWLEKHPASLYAFAFVFTFEVAELFQSALDLQAFVRRAFAVFLRLHS